MTIASSGTRYSRASIRAVIAVSALTILTAMAAEAQVAQPQPVMLPDVPLVSATGAPNSTKALPSQGRWLLIHIQPNCALCEALLARIQNDAPSVVPRLVIVVSKASGADVARVSAAFASLETAGWFADESGAIGSALQIQESPVVLAMHDRAIQWTLPESFQVRSACGMC